MARQLFELKGAFTLQPETCNLHKLATSISQQCNKRVFMCAVAVLNPKVTGVWIHALFLRCVWYGPDEDGYVGTFMGTNSVTEASRVLTQAMRKVRSIVWRF